MIKNGVVQMNKLIELDELKLELKNTQKLYLESLNRIDKAIELLNELLSSTKGVLNDYYSSRESREHNKILIELLREDEQAYIELLEILGGINEHRK